MVKLKTKEEAQRFAWESGLATTLREALVSSASLVESVRKEIPSARACVILSNSEREHSEILREYRLTDAFPEDSEDFVVGGAIWRRLTYILDDAGDGIVFFSHCRLAEKFAHCRTFTDSRYAVMPHPKTCETGKNFRAWHDARYKRIQRKVKHNEEGTDKSEKGRTGEEGHA